MSLSISSFLKSVPVTHLCWKDLFIMMDFHLIQWWITKGVRSGGRNHFRMGFACFPIVQTRGSHFPFELPLSCRQTSFRQIVHSCILRGGPNSSTFKFIQQAYSCLCHFFTLFVVDFHFISWHFVLTWPLSLSLSRREVLWRSCARNRFLRSGGVGVSGPDVDGDYARWCAVQGGKAGAALVCTALLRPAVCKTPCVSLCSLLWFCCYVRHSGAAANARMTLLHACQNIWRPIYCTFFFYFPFFSPSLSL